MHESDASRGTKPHLHLTSGRDHGLARAAAAAHEAEQNRLLHALRLDDYASLRPELELVRLRPRQVLIEPDEPITHAWFVRTGVASIIATDPEGDSPEGDSMEVGTIGFEGFVGLPLLLEDEALPNLVIASLEGEAWRIDADDFRRVLDERPAVRRMCLRYAAWFTAQLAQSVACNRIHTLEQRCAHWLLMTHDRVHHEPFALTHEFLAAMLGVRRAGVSIALGSLRNTGIIGNTCGRITVIDRARLKAASCSCHRLTQAALGRPLPISPYPERSDARRVTAETTDPKELARYRQPSRE